MTWVRLDEEFARHPKVASAGPLGIAMQVAALCYCNQYLTDGFVPRSIASGLLNLDGLGMRQWRGELFGGGEDASWDLIVEDLVDVGLWEEVEGGWVIHDYHEYQPSKAEVLELRKARSEAGKKGGKAKAQASAKASAKQTLEQNGSKTVARSRSRSRSRSRNPSPKAVQELEQRPTEEISIEDTIERSLRSVS